MFSKYFEILFSLMQLFTLFHTSSLTRHFLVLTSFMEGLRSEIEVQLPGHFVGKPILTTHRR